MAKMACSTSQYPIFVDEVKDKVEDNTSRHLSKYHSFVDMGWMCNNSQSMRTELLLPTKPSVQYFHRFILNKKRHSFECLFSLIESA